MPDASSKLHQLSPGPANAPEAQKALPHVLLVVDGFAKTLGGGERVVLRMAELLPQYGYRASILTFALDARSEFQITAAPCPVYLLPLSNTYNLAAWRGAFALRRLIQQQDVRIVQTFFESSDLWAGFFARTLTSAKVIWSRRDMGILRGPKHAQAYKILRGLPHAVTAVSEQVRQHAIKVDGIAPERVRTIHNGLEIKPQPRSRPVMSGTEVSVTTVGNIRRVKGHDLFIQAAAKVVKSFPNAQFTIAGDVLETEYHRELQTAIAALGLSGRVSFLGRITDLPAHLQTADLFVLPSRSEGFSNALIEAMANGLPVIATDVGGNAEAVQHRATGLIVPPEDADALADAMMQMLSDPAAAAQLGAAGQASAQANFTAEAMLQKTAALYASLLQV